jgi:argininosuccinate lyase
VLRDLDRAQAAFARTNAFPGGIGNINGTRLPVDRQRLSSLLGFDTLIANTRDAMWQTDQPVEVLAMLVAHLVHLDRLAEDLQIWNTQEFGLVELADRHARISMIMPQKKNPYSLAFVRGITGDMLGRLVSMAAVGKTPSAQMDNRIFAIGTVPRAVEETSRTTALLASVISAVRFDTELMRARAGDGFTYAMDLAETIMTECGLSYRSAHRIVGLAVRRALERDANARDIPRDVLDEAAREIAGRDLTELSAEALAKIADPVDVVASRTGVGGAAEAPVADMLAECREALHHAERWQIETQRRVGEAEGRLVELARTRAGGPAGGQPHG